LAEIKYNEKKYEEALSYYSQLEPISSSRNTVVSARIGMLRCQYFLEKSKEAIATADELIQMNSLEPGIIQEARYYRAKSHLNENKPALAKADLVSLSSESQTLIGAESRFMLAELYFNQGSLGESEKIIQQFIQEGTPYSYWLARSFILLSDIHVKNKNYFQARQYLQSLKENYHADDEITATIESRLKAIETK
jgi:TolA-binding protein